MSLRLRITSIVIFFSSIIFLLASILTVLNARSAIVDEVTSILKLAKQSIQPRNLNIKTLDLDNVRHLRVAVIADLSDLPTTIDKPSFIPGVPSLFVRFVLPDKQYLTLHLKSQSEEKYFLLADPTDEIRESWKETQVFLALLLGLTSAIAISVFLVVGRALQPVKIILDGLSEIKDGHFHKRLPHFNLPEYSSISRAFNGMVENLDQTQKENQALSEKMLNVQETERRLLARDLHDEMGQSLTAIKAYCASAKYYDSPQEVDDLLTYINSTCDDVFVVVRNMIEQLTPPLLAELGLIPALEELVAKWQMQNKCSVTLYIDPALQSLQGKNDIHLFRAVQESLTNALRHSGANHISISLTSLTSPQNNSFIKLIITDNGCGFDPVQTKKGTGLDGIRERAMNLKAELTVDSQTDKGTIITLTFEEDNYLETH